MESRAQIIHDANRRGWDNAARHYYASRVGLKANILSSGQGTLEEVEHKLLKDIPLSGSHVVHLQCADGSDTLSFLLLGAGRVTGVDISAPMLETAGELASSVGLKGEWVQADAVSPPATMLGEADLVYTGKGAIMWIHDLRSWASTISDLLKPGGYFMLYDLHPITALFRQDTKVLSPTGYNYLGQVNASRGWPRFYVGDSAPKNLEQPKKYERLWPLSETVQSLIDAGLEILHIGEHKKAYWTSFPKLKDEDRDTFPKTFSVVARKRVQQ